MNSIVTRIGEQYRFVIPSGICDYLGLSSNSKIYMVVFEKEIWLSGKKDVFYFLDDKMTDYTVLEKKIGTARRLVLSSKLCQHLGVDIGDPITVTTNTKYAVIRKGTSENNCVFCNSSSHQLTLFKGKYICPKCLDLLYLLKEKGQW